MAVTQLVSTGSGKSFFATKFTSSGTFTLPSGYGAGNPLYVEAFLVGGGGGSAGNLAATNNTWGGGGGGGGVKTDVLALTANAPVVVGLGGGYGPTVGAVGTYGGNGGNGGYTAVNATVKNLFLNPQLIGGSGLTNGAMPWVGTSISYSSAGGGALGGNIMSIATTNRAVSQPYRVTAGATYTLSFYANGVSAGVQSIVTASFFTSTTRSLTANSQTSVTTAAMTTSFVQYSFTFTVPVGSDMVLFNILGGQTVSSNTRYSNFQLELGSAATSYADGDTSGYAWVGSKDGGETVATGTYSAVAGGGGGGHAKDSSSISTTTMLSGFPGATSGGGCSFPQAAGGITQSSGGHGGGAGGPASPASITYATTGTWGFGPSSPFTPYGAGSVGFSTSGTATLVASRGAPGPGVQGYGMGGYGGGAAINGGTNPDLTAVATPNSGIGASGSLTVTPQSTTVAGCGNTGADGVVILRYWA